ncbi:MAG: sigma-70 family RNA polymerase sigma factor [Candidatus Competibacteraceae bacterium]
MDKRTQTQRFERVVLPHLAAAYNLARWLMRNDQDAEDAVQEAMLRAFRFIDGFRGGDSRVWLLTIVRHACFTCLRQNRHKMLAVPFAEEELQDRADGQDDVDDAADPGAPLLLEADRLLVNRALEALSAPHREVLVLRELEELSYREIAQITGVPIGTVMSRLAQARRRLREAYARVSGEV